MQVPGSKGPEQLAVEVAEALPAAGLELSLLWPLTLRGKGASSVKTSPFPFPGDSRGMFFAEAPKKETPTRRGENLLAPLPSALGAFAVGRGEGPPPKRCNYRTL